MTAGERGKLLWRIADLIERNIDEVAEIETLDNGKPIFESRHVDVPTVVEVFRFYAGMATKVHGQTINSRPNAFTYTLREPLGVVAAIVPWNFPLLLASWKIAPALAAGNTVIRKPASQTSLSALRVGELMVERTKKLRPGDPLDPKTRLGAIVSEQQMNTVLSYIDAGKKEGAQLVAGGNRVSVDGGKGYFLEPTIFDGVDNKMKIAQEEIF